MCKISIFENGQEITYFYCMVSEKDRVRSVLSTLMTFANRFNNRYQFEMSFHHDIKIVGINPRF